MGYDTIDALQDVEDDEIVGVKSSALRLGARSVAGIAFFYGFALVGLGAALWLKLPDPLVFAGLIPVALHFLRSEEHTSELQSLMRISYAVFCLKKKQIQISHKQ